MATKYVLDLRNLSFRPLHLFTFGLVYGLEQELSPRAPYSCVHTFSDLRSSVPPSPWPYDAWSVIQGQSRKAAFTEFSIKL